MRRVLAYLRQQHLGALALFIALGGTSYAVATGSIDSREIRNNSIRSVDVRNGSLQARDFRKGQLPAGAQGPQGPQGPQGEQGLRGLEGPQGPPGPTHRALVNRDGGLVSGTAVSSRKVTGPGVGDGNYVVTFPASVEGCAGAANVATFSGFLGTEGNSFISSLRIGFDDPKDVGVRVERPGGTSFDSAFSLVLACP